MENGMYDSDSNDFLNKIIIKNGQIVSGSFDKNSFTKTSKGLIHTIYNDLVRKLRTLLMIFKGL